MSEMAQGAPAPAEAVAPEAAELESQVEGSEGEQEVAEEAAPAEETKAEKEARKKKYELKVNNKVKAVELDLDNDAEIQKYLQKALAADEKFEEAAMTRKQAEALVEALRTNPLAVLMHPDLGVDVKALAQQVIMSEIEDAQKSPEQKRLEEMEAKLKAYEEEKTRLEEEKRQAELQRMEEQAYQQFDDQISSALAKTSLPKSPYVVKRIADAMIEAVSLGYEDVTVDEIMPYVENQVRGEIQQMFEIMPDDVMEGFLGKKRLDGWRKAKVAKVKATPKPEIKDTGASVTKPKEAKPEEKPKSFKDYFSGI